MPGQGLPTYPTSTAPRVADDVTLTAPTDDSGRWVISAGATHYYRVGSDLADLLRALDGRRGTEEIVAQLGDPWSVQRVEAGLDVARRMELLAGSDDERHALSDRRVKFVPPLTVQISLTGGLDRVFDGIVTALRPLRRMPRYVLGAIVGLFATGALICWAAQIGTTVGALGSKPGIGAIIAILAISLVGTGVHELAHGLALKMQGGRVNRMGVMLFYMMPAFFCDISDAWTLPRRSQRVRVALAGITVQCTVFGVTSIAAVIASAAGDHGLQRFLLLVAMTNIAMAVINLVPFVKLDGYIALMSWCDVNKLREASMRLVSDRTLRVLFGVRPADAPSVPRWRWAYGCGCLIFPVLIIYVALANWRSALSSLGIVGASVLALISLYLILVVGVLVVRGLRRARDAGAGVVRLVVVTGALSVAILAASLLTHTDETVDGAFVSVDGRTWFVSTDATVLAAVHAGQTVRLRENGIVLHPDVDGGVITTVRENRDVPLSSILPVGGLDLAVPATWVRIDGAETTTPDGLAQVTTGRVSVLQNLVDRFVWPIVLRTW